MLQSDEADWARASAADDRAFGNLFERHHPRVFRHALRLVVLVDRPIGPHLLTALRRARSSGVVTLACGPSTAELPGSADAVQVKEPPPGSSRRGFCCPFCCLPARIFARSGGGCSAGCARLVFSPSFSIQPRRPRGA